MYEDGLAQEDDAVWRRGGVDGRETWHGRCNSTALKMDWWQVAAAASYPACVLVEEHAGLVGAHTRQASWLGPQVLNVRSDCDVYLVLGQAISALYQLDRSSDSCCLDGDFSLTVI